MFLSFLRRAMLVFAVIFINFCASANNSDQENREREDLVIAPRLEPFSQRSGAWPHQLKIPLEGSQHLSNWWDDSRGEPGVDSRSQGLPAISIRGSVKGDRTLMMLDGIPLNLSDGLGPNELLIPYEIIGSTDFFKGPASVFYGRSALGGAINNKTQINSRPQAKVGINSLGQKSANISAPYSLKSTIGQISLSREADPGNFHYRVKSNGLEGQRSHNNSDKQSYTWVSESKIGSWQMKQVGVYAAKRGEYPGRLDSSPNINTSPNGTFDRQAELLGISFSRALEDLSSMSWTVAGIRSDQSYDSGLPSFSQSRTDRVNHEGT